MIKIGKLPVSMISLFVKDGAYYFYCAYVPCISRHLDFLSAVLINTGIFLRGSKLSGMQRKQNLAIALGIQKEKWG